MSSQPATPTSKFLSNELHSESTLPLLNFLLRSSPNDTVEDTTKAIHSVTAGIGVDPPPPIPAIPDERPDKLPDESVIDKTALINLINNGPGEGTKIPGQPTVHTRPPHSRPPHY